MSVRRWMADRRALRAEHRVGGGWLEYRRHRRAAKRALRAERRASGRGSHIEPGAAWGELGKGGLYTPRNAPPRK